MRNEESRGRKKSRQRARLDNRLSTNQNPGHRTFRGTWLGLRKNWLKLGLGLSVGISIFIVLGHRPQASRSSLQASQNLGQVPHGSTTVQSPSVPQGATPSPPTPTPERDQAWKKFDEAFGPGLKPEFSPTGRLISVVSEKLRGSRLKFQNDDSVAVIAQTDKIIAAAGELLQIHPEWPLEKPEMRGSPYSSQVFYSEYHRGIPLVSVGSVKVELGAAGELVALYSDYTPPLQLTNSFQEDPQGRRSVIWVVNAREGRLAYESFAQGRQIITDAETGQILSTRDRRQF